MAGRSQYSDQDKARAYVVLTANGGNIKRTVRDLGNTVPITTLRDWRRDWEENGPPDTEGIEAIAADFVAEAERIRDLALAEMERKIPSATPSALVAMVGMLTDKITLARGLPTSRQEQVQSLPPADQLRELMHGFVAGAIEASKTRDGEIIDAEWEEQAPKALPRARV